MADGAKVLVVANRTANSKELLDAMRERAGRGPVHFHLVVPASGHGATLDFDAGHDAAEHDLDGALGRLREFGLDVDGEVGDPDPVAAVSDSAHAGSYDEVIVSTLPKHVSKWLRVDAARKIAHSTGLPVQHVEAHSRSRSPA